MGEHLRITRAPHCANVVWSDLAGRKQSEQSPPRAGLISRTTAPMSSGANHPHRQGATLARRRPGLLALSPHGRQSSSNMTCTRSAPWAPLAFTAHSKASRASRPGLAHNLRPGHHAVVGLGAVRGSAPWAPPSRAVSPGWQSCPMQKPLRGGLAGAPQTQRQAGLLRTASAFDALRLSRDAPARF
jgi:hypothetical protein